MKCQVCKGTGIVRVTRGPNNVAELHPALEIGDDTSPCVACQGTGSGGHDFDHQIISLRQSDDDPPVTICLSRIGAAGTNHPILAEFAVNCGSLSAGFQAFSAAQLRQIAEFCNAYADRMGRW